MRPSKTAVHHASFALLAIALGAKMPLAYAGECHMQLVAHLKLAPSDNRPLVPITLDNKQAQLMLDTGAFTSLLSLTSADRLGLARMRVQETTGASNAGGYLGTYNGIGGGRTATAVTARHVDLAGLKARDYNFTAADVDFGAADGLLSVDLISNFDIDLDFPENQVILFRPDGDCSAPAAFLNSPLYPVPLRPTGQDKRPRVNIMVNGQPVIAMVDTGADHSAIFRHTAERVGLHMEAASPQQRGTASGIGPNKVASARMNLASVEVGDLEFQNMKVDVLDDRQDDEVEMLLGAEFQRKVHLWISYSSHTLIMQYPPTASKKAQ